MGSQHPDVIDFAGDYNLTGIVLQNHAGTGGNFDGAEAGVKAPCGRQSPHQTGIHRL